MTGTINCAWLSWFFVFTISVVITCIWKRTLIEFIRCWMFARIDSMCMHFVNCQFTADDARVGRVLYSARAVSQNTDWRNRLKLGKLISLECEYRKIKQKIAIARQNNLWFIDEAGGFKNEILRDILKSEGFIVWRGRTNMHISWKSSDYDAELMYKRGRFKRYFIA